MLEYQKEWDGLSENCHLGQLRCQAIFEIGLFLDALPSEEKGLSLALRCGLAYELLELAHLLRGLPLRTCHKLISPRLDIELNAGFFRLELRDLFAGLHNRCYWIGDSIIVPASLKCLRQRRACWEEILLRIIIKDA